jgi:hypothetical protein
MRNRIDYRKYRFHFTYSAVAEYVGKSIHAVHIDRSKDKFDPDDLSSFIDYCVSRKAEVRNPAPLR